MREQLIRIKKIKDEIVGLEMQLNLITNDLSIAEYNLEQLAIMERDLLYNISILKRKGIIARASEYKKSILELSAVRQSQEIYVNIVKRCTKVKEENHTKHAELSVILKREEKQVRNQKVILLFDTAKRKKK